MKWGTGWKYAHFFKMFWSVITTLKNDNQSYTFEADEILTIAERCLMGDKGPTAIWHRPPPLKEIKTHCGPSPYLVCCRAFMEILHHFPGSKYIPNGSKQPRKIIVDILFAPDSSVLKREERRQRQERMDPSVVAQWQCPSSNSFLPEPWALCCTRSFLLFPPFISFFHPIVYSL